MTVTSEPGADAHAVNPAAVRISGCSKTFPGQKALDEVSFDIGDSTIHALLGHNGSGKSTLIKIMAGIHTPDAGSEIEIHGSPLTLGSPRDSARLGLRFVHQDLGLISELSASENMALTWGYARGVAGRIVWKRHDHNVRAALSRMNVELDVKRPVGELRAVERTAVAIARALGEPDSVIDVLVLDEPTAALPPAEVESLFEILRDISGQGVSILYVSHRLGEVLALADVASVLRDGVLQGTVGLRDMRRDELVRMIVGELDGDVPSAEEERRNAHAGAEASRATTAPVFAVKLSTAVLDDVEIDLHVGEVVGVAGLAGSGREELCESIIGAAGGSVEIVDGATGQRHVRMTPARARSLGIALVLPNRFPGSAVLQFSVAENVSLASLGGVSRSGVVSRASESRLARNWIDRLDIRPGDPTQMYAHLSGGNQQKTVFAKWLQIAPRALLLEDPTTGVDVGARNRIYSLIEDQAANGLTVLVASSDVEDLVALCDRVLVMSHGRLVEEIVGSEITEASLLGSLTRMGSGESTPVDGDAA